MFGKISVSKRGDVYRVPVDPVSMQPIHISSHDDEPVGSFLQTYNGLGELHAAWPGREFNFLEAPKKPENTVGPLPPALAKKVDDMAKKFNVDRAKGATTPTRVVPVATEVGHVLSPAPEAGVDLLVHKATEVLRRMQTAREYASKKNQRELEIKIAAMQELINEVFGQQ